MSDELEKHREDPAADTESTATIEELIARGKVHLDAIREIAKDPDREHRLPEIVEHAGGLVEVLGDVRPHIDTKGEREEIAAKLLGKVGVDNDFARAIIAVAEGLIRLWRKRREDGGGSAVAAGVPGVER